MLPGPRPLRGLVIGDLSAAARALVRTALADVELELAVDPGEPDLGREATVDLVWHQFGDPARLRRVLDANPALAWLHTSAAGIDSLRDAIGDRPRLTVTHGAGIAATPIAEFVLACLLAHVKRLPDLAAQHRERRWEVLPLRELADLLVVVVGLGTIGSGVTERLAPFGAHVVGVRRHPERRPPAGVARVVGLEDLGRACAGADALILAVPLTPTTGRLVGPAVLSALAPGSVVINVARGALLDEAALLAGLAVGRPAAAYLDALAEEPLPSSSPLWTAPGVLVTPHTSWSSPHFEERSAALFADQVRRWLDGRPLRNVVDQALGY